MMLTCSLLLSSFFVCTCSFLFGSTFDRLQAADMPGMSQRQKDETQLGQKWGHSAVLLQGLSTRNLRFKGAAAGSREPSSILLCFGGWTVASSADVAKGGATNAPMAHVDLYSVRYRTWKRMETKVGGATEAARKDLAAHLPRGYHTATALVDSRYMLVFGGVGADGRPAARTVVLDTSSWMWHAPELSPLSMAPPEPRWRHAAAHYPDEPEESEGGDVDAVWDTSATAIIIGGYEGGAALTGTAYSVRLETSDNGSAPSGRGRGKATTSVAPVTLRWAELDRSGAQAACRADGVLVPLPELNGWVFACGADEAGPSNALTLLQVGPHGEKLPSPPSGAAVAAPAEAAAAAAAAASVTPRTRTKSPAARRRGGAKASLGSEAVTPPSPSPPARKAAGRKATSAARKSTSKVRGGSKELAAAADGEAAGLAAAAAAAATVATVDPPAADDDAGESLSPTKSDSPPPAAAGRTPAARKKAGTPAKSAAAAAKKKEASAKRAAPTTGGGGVRKRRRLAEPPPVPPAAALDGDGDGDEDNAADDGDGDEEPPYEPPAAAPPLRAAVTRRPTKSSVKAATRPAPAAAPAAPEEFGGTGGGPARPPPPAPRADTRTKAQLLVALDTALSHVEVERAVTSTTKTTVDGLRAAAASHAKAMAALKDENARLRAAATLAENRASSARTGALLGPSAGGGARRAAAATAAASAAAAAAAAAATTASALSAEQNKVRSLQAEVEDLRRQAEDASTERHEAEEASRGAVKAATAARKTAATATAAVADARAQLSLARADAAEWQTKAKESAADRDTQVEAKREAINESSTLRIGIDAEKTKRDRAAVELSAAAAARKESEREVERLRGVLAEAQRTARELRDQLDASVRTEKAERTARVAAEVRIAEAEAEAHAAEARAQNVTQAALESSTRRAAATSEERRERARADAALADAQRHRTESDILRVHLKNTKRECERLSTLVRRLQTDGRGRRDAIRRVVAMLGEVAAVGPDDEAALASLPSGRGDTPEDGDARGGSSRPPAVERTLFPAGGAAAGSGAGAGNGGDSPGDDGDQEAGLGGGRDSHVSDSESSVGEDDEQPPAVKVTQSSVVGGRGRPSDASVVRLSQSGASVSEQPVRLSAATSGGDGRVPSPPRGALSPSSGGSAGGGDAVMLDATAAAGDDAPAALARAVTQVRPEAAGVDASASLGMSTGVAQKAAAGATAAEGSTSTVGAAATNMAVRGVTPALTVTMPAAIDGAAVVGNESMVAPSMAATVKEATTTAAEEAVVSATADADIATTAPAVPAAGAIGHPVAMQGVANPAGSMPAQPLGTAEAATDASLHAAAEPSPTVSSLPDVDSAFSLEQLSPLGGGGGASRSRSVRVDNVRQSGAAVSGREGSTTSDDRTPAGATPEGQPSGVTPVGPPGGATLEVPPLPLAMPVSPAAGMPQPPGKADDGGASTAPVSSRSKAVASGELGAAAPASDAAAADVSAAAGASPATATEVIAIEKGVPLPPVAATLGANATVHLDAIADGVPATCIPTKAAVAATVPVPRANPVAAAAAVVPAAAVLPLSSPTFGHCDEPSEPAFPLAARVATPPQVDGTPPVVNGNVPPVKPAAPASSDSDETLTPVPAPLPTPRSRPPLPPGVPGSEPLSGGSGVLLPAAGSTGGRPTEALGDSQSFKTAISLRSKLAGGGGESQSFKTAVSRPAGGAASVDPVDAAGRGGGDTVTSRTSPVLPVGRANGTLGETAAEAREGVAPRAVAADAFVDGLVQTAMDAVLASQE